MRVAAVILNWNQAALTERAAASVAEQVAHVYIADNGSRAEVADRLASFARIHGMSLVSNGGNLGWAGGNNPVVAQAVAAGFGAILVMNNDAIGEPGSVATLVERLDGDARLGAVAPMVTEGSGVTVLHVACWVSRKRGRVGWTDRGRSRIDVDSAPVPTGYVSGEAFLARAEVLERYPFDESYGMYFEDADWSVRVCRAGWRLEVVPAAVFRHELSSSVGSASKVFMFARGRVLFMRRALGMSRCAALLHSAPRALRQAVSHLRRGRLRHAVQGELAGELAGLIRRL